MSLPRPNPPYERVVYWNVYFPEYYHQNRHDAGVNERGVPHFTLAELWLAFVRGFRAVVQKGGFALHPRFADVMTQQREWFYMYIRACDKVNKIQGRVDV